MKNINCIICRKPLNNGIIINSKGICKSCEERMLNMDVENDLYIYMVKRIKNSLVKPILRGVDGSCQYYHL